MTIGVYGFYNTKADMIYVGSSKTIENRKCRHISDLNSNTHTNRYLQQAWNQDGASSFVFFILGTCELHERIELEKEWINFFRSNDRNFGYNIAEPGCTPDFTGRKHTEEAKEKIREYNRTRTISEATREKHRVNYYLNKALCKEVLPRYCSVCGVQIFIKGKHYSKTCGSQNCIKEACSAIHRRTK